jgi:hypothetical protein
MPANLALSRTSARSVVVRPFRSLLGDSRFLKRLPASLPSLSSIGPAPRRLWDPGVLDRLRMPLSRIRE